MKNLITAEIIKLSRAKSVKTCITIYFIYLFIMALVGDAMNPERNYGYMAPINELFANNSLRLTILSIIVSVNICLEYQNRMLNNIISVGINKIKYFIAKVATLSLFVVLFDLIAVVLDMFIETLRFGFGSNFIWFENYFVKISVYIIFSILLDLIGISFCILISYITKNTIITIIIFYAYAYIGFLMDKHLETHINKVINITGICREAYYTYFKKDLLLTSEYFTMYIPCLIFGTACLVVTYIIVKHSDVKTG